MHSIGLKPRKLGMILAKANVQVQTQFVNEELEPRLAQAKGGKHVVFC